MADPDVAATAIGVLTEIGIRLSIDDFGTGYSSFGQLTQLPFSQIKIDRSFVSGLLASNSDRVIVHSITNLGRDLGLEVVAEGIEDASTLDALARLGCDSAQGYHLSPPIPARRLAEWARSFSAGGPEENGALAGRPSADNVVLLADAS